MTGQTSFKCEHCDVSFCLSSRLPCFRLYHSMELVRDTPRASRGYSVKDRSSEESRGNGNVSKSMQSVINAAHCNEEVTTSQESSEQESVAPEHSQVDQLQR